MNAVNTSAPAPKRIRNGALRRYRNAIVDLQTQLAGGHWVKISPHEFSSVHATTNCFIRVLVNAGIILKRQSDFENANEYSRTVSLANLTPEVMRDLLRKYQNIKRNDRKIRENTSVEETKVDTKDESLVGNKDLSPPSEFGPRTDDHLYQTPSGAGRYGVLCDIGAIPKELYPTMAYAYLPSHYTVEAAIEFATDLTKKESTTCIVIEFIAKAEKTITVTRIGQPHNK